MKNLFFLPIAILIFCAATQITCAQSKSGNKPKAAAQSNNRLQYDCLPENIKPDQIVSVIPNPAGREEKFKRETVKQRLDKLDARCAAGKLIDGKKREIRFYQLQGCWGNPPADYQEILSAQEKELKELKKKFAVVEITCNSSGEMLY